MAPSPGRPPDDRRQRHEKPPVTAPSHKSTGSYVLPACQVSKNLARIAALERKVEPDTDNCLEMLEQMKKAFPVAVQRAQQIITAVMAESQGDHSVYMEHMFQIIAEDLKKIQEITTFSANSALSNGILEPSPTQIFPPVAAVFSNARERYPERSDPVIGERPYCLEISDEVSAIFNKDSEITKLSSAPVKLLILSQAEKKYDSLIQDPIKDQEKFVKEQAALTYKIQEMVESQKAREERHQALFKKFQEDLGSKLDSYKVKEVGIINSLSSKVELSRSECPKHASEKRPDCPAISAPSPQKYDECGIGNKNKSLQSENMTEF